MTADTFSSTLGFLTMGTGNDNNTWGGNANTAVFQIFEDAIANALTSTVTGGTLDLSGSPPPAAASQVHYAALIFNGTLGSGQIIQVPNLQKLWWVKNATAGAFTLKLQTPAAVLSTAIPQNSGWQCVYCDGANNIVVMPFNSQQIQMPDGSSAAPAYSNVTEPKSGWYRNGTQDWRLAINGTDILQITGAGAGTPSIVNVLSPNVLQIAGAQVPFPGAEQACAAINLPAGGWLWEDGTAYSRSTYANLFNAITTTAIGDTNTSTAITNLTTDMRGKGLDGAFVEGTGIQTGTTITFTGATTATLSQAATSSNAGLTFRILPFGQGDASTTFNVPDRRYRVLVGRDDMNNNPAGRSSAFAGTHLATTGGEESHTLLNGEVPVLPSLAHSHVIPQLTGSGWTQENAVDTTGTTGYFPRAVVSGGANSTNTALASISYGGGTAHNNMQGFGITDFVIKT